jgi:hypothetical protein
MPSMTTTDGRAAEHRALLRTIPMDLLEQEIYRRGRIVCVASRCRYGDRLPPGYPPLADDDVPFDGKDTRS